MLAHAISAACDCVLYHRVHDNLVQKGRPGPSGFKWRVNSAGRWGCSHDLCHFGSIGETLAASGDRASMNWVFAVPVSRIFSDGRLDARHTPTSSNPAHCDVVPMANPPTEPEDLTDLRRELATIAISMASPLRARDP